MVGVRATYEGPNQSMHSDEIDEDFLFQGMDYFSRPAPKGRQNEYPNIDMSKSMCTEAEKKIMMELFRKYRNAFANGPEDLKTPARVPPLDIPTGDAKPISVPPYPMTTEKKKLLQAEIDKLVEQGVVKPISQTLWRFPAMLVSKKDGTHRLVTYLRHLNECITALPAHPLPSLADFRCKSDQHLIKDCKEEEQCTFCGQTGHRQRSCSAFLDRENYGEYADEILQGRFTRNPGGCNRKGHACCRAHFRFVLRQAAVR